MKLTERRLQSVLELVAQTNETKDGSVGLTPRESRFAAKCRAS